MNTWRRVLAFLLLNVVVSASITLLVLYLWENQHPRPALPPDLPEISLQITQTVLASTRVVDPTAIEPVLLATPVPTLAPGQVIIVIDNIIGSGVLPDEAVLLKNQSPGSLGLTDWKLEDGESNSFTFPILTLNKGGAVQVHTTAGANTVIDLYWGKDTAVWKSGKQITLLDDQGAVRATYKIP
jgi:hypothetical protein